MKDLIMITPDGREYNVGEIHLYEERDDLGRQIFDATLYVKVFEGYISVAVSEGVRTFRVEAR